jgi:hypothetical protein
MGLGICVFLLWKSGWTAMKASLPLAVISSIAVLCGLSGTAMSEIATGAVSTLPRIEVVAPKRVARPHRAEPAARPYRPSGNPAASRRTSPTARPFTPAQESVLAKLARLERSSGSCVGGCQTSFPSGGKPWIGCSSSGWPSYSGTCKNPRNYKTYVECTETSHFLGWRPMEYHWYCTSLALKK